jgi:diadenosine tetraphosphate (Ap4A) HIT family hydrolase
VFSQIIAGQVPARMIWQDDQLIAFLSIAPIRPGHTLVVPRREIDQWTDTDGELLGRCVTVAQIIGRAVKDAFAAPRAGLLIAGFEVPHLHVHVFPAWGMADFDIPSATVEPDQSRLDDAQDRLRGALRAAGHGRNVAS